MPDTEQQLLALTEEAAVLVRGGRAVYANAAARGILGEDCVGKRVAALFGQVVAGVQASAFLAQICLRERPYLLRIARLEQGQVFFLRPQEELPAVLNAPFLYALRSSLMNLDLAAEQLRACAEQQGSAALLENLRSVARSEYQILRLLNNASLILDLAQGKAVFSPRTVSLGGLCASLLDALAPMLPRIRFVARREDDVPVSADPALVKALLMNLLSNAIRHGKGCTQISVSLMSSARNLVLAVHDDGCGIPPEELPLVFDRYRHDFQLSQMSAGPGLGLTAARLIAQLHGGTLLLESRPGQGTTLRVSLQRGGEKLAAPGEPESWDSRELLTGLADCLPASCFGEQFLD